MLTGSVVADSEYVELLALLERRRCTFRGTLTRTHDHGESNTPISILLHAPAADSNAEPPPIAAARASLGWKTELVECFHTECSIATIGLSGVPALAALDVDAEDCLRLLIVAADAPFFFGRLICRLLPRDDPPSLVGRAEASSAFSPEAWLRTQLVEREPDLPPAEGAQPIEAPLAEDDAATADDIAAGEDEVEEEDADELIACAAPILEEVAAGGLYRGSLHHRLLGALGCALALIEKVWRCPPLQNPPSGSARPSERLLSKLACTTHTHCSHFQPHTRGVFVARSSPSRRVWPRRRATSAGHRESWEARGLSRV